MPLDKCGCICKNILILSNIVLLVLGGVFLGCALSLRFGETREIFDINQLQSAAFVTDVYVLTALGAVTLTLTLFGFLGACGEKRCHLTVFGVFLCFLTVTVFGFGVIAIRNREEVEKELAELYAEIYLLYVKNGGGALTEALTFIHNFFHCCGMTGIPIIEIVKKTCPKDDILEPFVMRSCPVSIFDDFDSWSPKIAAFLFGIGGFLIILALLSRVLVAKIQSSPLYIILTNSTAALVDPQPFFQPVSIPPPNQNLVIFTAPPVVTVPGSQT